MTRQFNEHMSTRYEGFNGGHRKARAPDRAHGGDGLFPWLYLLRGLL